MFFGPSFKLFRVAGIPVTAHWSLFIVLGLMAWSFGGWAGLIMSVLLFGSILLLAFAAGGYAVDWDSRRRHGGFRI